jgi:hypothetical protein
MKRSRLPLGFEFYTKYVVFGDRNAGAARYITLTFAYPTSQRNIYDPAVTKINFRILGAQLLTTDSGLLPIPLAPLP